MIPKSESKIMLSYNEHDRKKPEGPHGAGLRIS
jgi:hypothetical protein